MTKKHQASHRVQRADLGSGLASCRGQTLQPEIPGTDTWRPRKNEQDYLLFTIKEIQGYLREELSERVALSEEDSELIRGRLSEAGLLIELI